MRAEPWSNLPLKMLALAFAAFLWVVLRAEAGAVRDLEVPVQLAGLEEELALADELIDSVVVRVRAPDLVLATLTPQSIEVRLELGSLGVGEHFLPVTADAIRMPSSVRLVKVTPDVLPVTVEERKRRTIPVEARFEGEPAEGFEIYGVTVTPPALRIEGPASAVDAISRAFTAAVRVTGATADVRATVGSLPEGARSNVRVLDPAPVEVAVQIGEQRVQRVFDEVPIELEGKRYRTLYNPRRVSVELTGPKSRIDALDGADVRVLLALEGVEPQPEDQRIVPRVVIAPELGEGVEVVAIRQPYIDVRVFDQPETDETPADGEAP